ncbi:prepilin peptidase [Candidatus Saccharibacteria bacterium]|nr:prepilin peptidase [Candidatus Saccharibacteria bacterium]
MLILIGLFLLGLSLGSFVNALVWRLRQQELSKQRTINKEQKNNFSILNGRSICPNCRHKLTPRDLVPILSWILLRGKCRYCNNPISIQYPLVELLAATVFIFSYVFWPASFSNGQWLLFITWLAASVGLLALAVYDLKWMFLPNRILYPTFFIALVGQLGYILFFANNKAHSFWLLALSWLVASGLFLAIYLVSSGKWIGFGDVRLGLVTGTLLATPAKSLVMIFLASVLGTLFVLPALASGRRKMASKLPFGPFLIASTGLVILFGQPLLDWYQRLLT